MKTKKVFCFVIYGLIFLFPAFVYAQNIETKIYNEERLLKDEYIRDLKKTETPSALPPEKKFKFFYGGWLSTIYRRYKDLENNKDIKDLIKSIWSQDVRFWGNLVFENNNYIYVRMQDTYSLKENTSEYTGPAPNNDNYGPVLEMGYVSLNYKKAELQAGRQYFSVGRGIAYSSIHDGATLRVDLMPWILKAFLSHSLPHEDDIDYSIPGYDKKANNRFFSGLEFAYFGIPENVLYGYFVNQSDHSIPYPEDANQAYGYNSRYLGLGVSAVKKNLEYWCEIIKEFGASYTDNLIVPVERRSVDAWASIAGARYKFNAPFNPITEAEFACGSGDKDRANVTNTIDGNVFGRDTNFMYFGNYYGGYALSPRLSNIYIYKVEQSVEPFFKLNLLKNVVLGTKYFVYCKDKGSGGISDTDATAPKGFIGTEINFYLHWKMNENFYFSTRYGEFYPGKAYQQPAKADTKYIYGRLTYIF